MKNISFKLVGTNEEGRQIVRDGLTLVQAIKMNANLVLVGYRTNAYLVQEDGTFRFEMVNHFEAENFDLWFKRIRIFLQADHGVVHVPRIEYATKYWMDQAPADVADYAVVYENDSL